MWDFSTDFARMAGNLEAIPQDWSRETRCWSGNRGRNNAFATAIGGRIPWRKANTNEPLRLS